MPSILIVDDDPSTCQILATALSLDGFTTATALSPNAALKLAKKQIFDLLLLDFRLGSMTGLELELRLKEAGCQAPFLLMSAYLDTAIVVQAMRQGARTVLTSPVDIQDLPGIIHDALEPLSTAANSIAVESDVRPLLATAYAPGSAADRLARRILRARASEVDLPTVDAWAHHDGVGHSTLSDLCWLCNVAPRDARDFTRMLRAIWMAASSGSSIRAFLQVGGGCPSSC